MSSRSVLLLGISSIFCSLSAHADLTGTGYALGSNHGTVLFTFKRSETRNGHTLSADTKYTDPQGNFILEEKSVAADDGRQIMNYSLDRKQDSQSGSLAVRDGKIAFSWTKDGKTETDSEDAKPNLIIGPSTVPYLQAHWAELMKGDNVDTRYAALERKETVGFKFFKVDEGTLNGQPTVRIEMKPASFVIAALVKPLYFTFDKEGKHLLELEGRALPKQNADGKWKDLDADIIYQYTQ